MGAEVEVGADSTTQVGGVIAWPMSSTPRAGHVTW